MELYGLRIMITGGAGFIGSHLADRLLDMNNQIVAYDNFDKYYTGKENNIREYLENPSFKLVKADILDNNTLSKSMEKVDVVFHLAAKAGVGYSLENPFITNTVNTSGTLNVLEAAKKCGVIKVIYSSSSTVYGEPQYMPWDEKHPTNPISFYGASKLAAEKFCKIYNDLLGLSTVILRYHTVYGPRQRPDLAISKWTNLIFNNKIPKIYGNGKQTRDFTYIDDIIDGTLKAAEIEDAEGQIFNLGSGSRKSINDVLKLLLTISDKEHIEPIYEEPRLGDIHDTQADISKARALLGYDPKVEISTGLKKYVKWFESYINKKS